MATQIGVWNEALRFLGHPALATTTDDVEARYVLDGAWLEAINFVLRQAPWRFALKTLPIVTSGVGFGYSSSFAKPADWLRTHAIFVPSGARECPIDAKEDKTKWYANVTPVTFRYVSSDFDDVDDWTEQFSKALSAYLAFVTCEKITGDANRTQQMFSNFQQHLTAALEVDAVPESPWLIPQLDGSFLASSRYVLEQGGWRFALSSVTITASGTPEVGFSRAFSKPADYHKLVSAFVLDSSNRELPVDMRESDTIWSAATPSTTLSIRYVSTDGLNSVFWSETFTRVVAAHLGIDTGDGASAAGREGEPAQKLWPQYLQAALSTDAVPFSPWLAAQLDGRFRSSARTMLQQAFWNFALKTGTPSSSGTAVPGFSTSYAKPADWLRTHAVFKVSGAKEWPVDVREQGGFWSANEAIKVRYISTDYLDAASWPEQFLRLVGSHLGIDQGDGGGTTRDSEGRSAPMWPAYLADAVQNLAIPPNPWLTYQLDGSFLPGLRYVLEQGRWRFAVKTAALTANVATPSIGYDYAFDKPADWFATVHVYYGTEAVHDDIDYRDEGGDLHANYAPIVLRYLSSTLGDNSSTWSDGFEHALLSYLSYRRALSNPDSAGAQVEAKRIAWERAKKSATLNDDMRERVIVRRPSILTAARLGMSSREQGL